MKFQNLIESLLLELTGDEIYQKYYSKIPYDTFKSIVAADPQSKIENEKVTRIGKYGKLLISMYQKGGLQLEDLEKASEYLGYVYSHNVAVDIKQINELGDLYNLVSQFIVKDKLDLPSILAALKQNEDYKFLYDGNDWLIFQPLTEKGSAYLGYNTEWCTAWGEHSTNKKHKERGCLFKKHHNQGPLYIIINKNNNDEKYQFHFESKQYMDKDDRRVNTENFLKQRQELMGYFFPSFTREVSKEDIQNELKRLDVLSDEDGTTLIKKSIGVVNNRIANALLSDDNDMLNELITTDGEISSYIYKGRLVIETEGFEQDAIDAENTLIYYDYEANNGSDWVREDIKHLEPDIMDEMMLTYFESFYNEKTSEINRGLGVHNFDQFMNDFFTLFRHNENLVEWFEDKILDISVDDYETENANVSNNIREVMDFVSDRELHISIPKFVTFLVTKGIDEISDSTNPLWDVIDKFISENDIPLEFEAQYTPLNTPKFAGDPYGIDKYTVEFFENIIDNPEDNSKCAEYRKQFYDIVKKYFNNGTVYKNDHVTVILKSMEVNCQDGTVQIRYTNNDTGESFGLEKGKDNVKIDNLVSLMTNYKLFESIYIPPKIIRG
jgi:hypothetical protein